MKVLFIGGSGLISQAVSRLAVQNGIDLYLFNRGNQSAFAPEGAKVIFGDIRDVSAAKRILDEYQFDVVVDWIAFTPKHVKADLDLFQGRTSQFVFISSASAYQKPPAQYIVTESTPLANPYWQYSRDKIACEEKLMEAYRTTGFPITIVRPSFTYGDTMIPASLNSWQHPWSLVDRMRRGKKVIVHGDGQSLWTMTHNTDFAKGFVGLLGNQQALGHAFHITSDEVLTWDQIYEAIGRAGGVKPILTHISSEFIIACDPSQEGGLLGDKAVSQVFDNSKLKRIVPGFTATVSFVEGIRRTIQWFEAHPERCTLDTVWAEQMDHMIALHEGRMAKKG